MLVLLHLLIILSIPVIFLGLDWIVAHPLRVIHLLIMLPLLFVGYGLCATHLVISFHLLDVPQGEIITFVNVQDSLIGPLINWAAPRLAVCARLRSR
jgi:hypothetical protein